MDDDALEALRREAEMEGDAPQGPRELDGTDLRAKRRQDLRRDAQDGDGATGGEADESLERQRRAPPLTRSSAGWDASGS